VPPHDVHVWYRPTDALDATALAAAVSVLSDEERARYHRFRFSRDGRDYAAAHALLRATLSRGNDRAPADWRFDRTANGKPFLIGPGEGRISFSLSHATGMVACVASEDADVGVDVERIDRNVDVVGVAGRFFSQAEAAQFALLDANRQRDRFFDLWTLKEAFAKALGVGVAESLTSVTFTVGGDDKIRLDASHVETDLWQFGLFAPGPTHRLAVAARRPASTPPAQLIFHSVGHAD
jgi:4'-phosphopantetheinyl transferase